MEDCLTLIMTHLNVDDVVACSLVSRQFHQATERGIVWETLMARDSFAPVCADSKLSYILRYKFDNLRRVLIWSGLGNSGVWSRFRDLKKFAPNLNSYIGNKTIDKYRTTVSISLIKKENYEEIMTMSYDLAPGILSSFESRGNGLREEVYPRVTKYYVNGTFFGLKTTDEIDAYLFKAMRVIDTDGYYSEVKKFIYDTNANCRLFFDLDRPFPVQLTVKRCGLCGSIEDPVLSCDFCETILCNSCAHSNRKTFKKCPHCNTIHCAQLSCSNTILCEAYIDIGVCSVCLK